MSNELSTLSIVEAVEKLSKKEVSAVDLVRVYKQKIEEKNSSLNAYLEVFDDIEIQANIADTRRAQGESHALLGIPLAVKDNILIEGRCASAGSKMLAKYVASYDATVIQRLKKAGAIFLGRTNMDEFALGGSTENSAFGPTKNPHDTSRVAGGTSGGSAAAVAGDMALGALGSDTGGSVRNPASFCGVVGLKPTYGAVSRMGLIAAASSFDQIGPLTKTVADAELLFTAICGYDPLDSTSLKESSYATVGARNKKIGVPRHLFGNGVASDVLQKFEETLKTLQQKGYTVVDVELPSASLAIAAYYITNFAEVSSNLARFDGIRYGLSLPGASLFDDYATSRASGFGIETRRRIMLGTYVLSAGYYDAYYGKAMQARAQLLHELTAVLAEVSTIATPTMPFPAFKVGEKSDPLSMYLADIFTVLANLTGNPAISIPCGTVARGDTLLPVGIQCTSAHADEQSLFEVGKQIEENSKRG